MKKSNKTVKAVTKKTDKKIVSGVLLDDERSVCRFFFEECAPIFEYIIRVVFNQQVEKDELISEYYLYLKEKNWHKLRQFNHRCQLKTWISVTATRFFIKKRTELIKNESSEHLIEEQTTEDYDTFSEEDITNLLNGLKERYRFVIQKLILEDREPQKVAEEMGVTVDNLYNIKRRALLQLAGIVKKEVIYAEYERKNIIL